MLSKLFISYRRDDSSAMAGRVSDRLADVFPRHDIFIDIEMPAGKNWHQVLEKTIAVSDLMIVVIGPDWLGIDPDTGDKRINNPNDYVRFEIYSALRRGIAIQPLLVEGTTMPSPDSLPEDIRELAYLQGINISSSSFRKDMPAVIERIRAFSPRLMERLVYKFVNTPTYAVLLSFILIGALTLFAARMLNIGIFKAEQIVTSNVVALEGISIEKELGLFLALNWSLFFIFFMPVLIFLFHATLQESNRLIAEIDLKRMLVYVDPEGQRFARPASNIWTVIVRRTAIAAALMMILAVMLGSLQWYQYSGHWYFSEFDLDRFLKVSTGPDWQVAWGISPEFSSMGGQITSFSLFGHLEKPLPESAAA